ncbi:hypothetical protein [Rubrivirga sp.]|uniref:hypothetical protein n=1 Tax=Rubrivirga sp. TaxID=1885344 RepID=UPI003C707456
MRAVTFTMLWLAALVVVLDLWLYLGRGIASSDLAGWFNATSERGLGSWLSVTQTVLIAVTLWGFAALLKASGERRRRVWGWTALAVFFSYLALDDGTFLHERIGSATADVEGVAVVDAFPSYYWQLVLGPFLIGAGLLMVAFLRREIEDVRLRRYVLAAVALMGTAVALDFVDGLGADHPFNAYAWLAGRYLSDATAGVLFDRTGLEAVVHVSRSVEESLEMASMTLLWATFLSHAAASFHVVTVRIEDAAADPVLDEAWAAAVPTLA